MPASFPWNLTVGEILDVFGRPGRKFYEVLSMLAKDPQDKKELSFILTKEGKEQFLTNYLKETVTFADLIYKFPSALPSLE